MANSSLGLGSNRSFQIFPIFLKNASNPTLLSHHCSNLPILVTTNHTLCAYLYLHNNKLCWENEPIIKPYHLNIHKMMGQTIVHKEQANCLSHLTNYFHTRKKDRLTRLTRRHLKLESSQRFQFTRSNIIVHNNNQPPFFHNWKQGKGDSYQRV